MADDTYSLSVIPKIYAKVYLSRHSPVKVKLTNNKHYWLKAHQTSEIHKDTYPDTTNIGLEYFALSLGASLGVSPSPTFLTISIDEASFLWPELIKSEIIITNNKYIGCLAIPHIPNTVSDFNSFRKFKNNELVHMFQLWLGEYDGFQVLVNYAKEKVYAIDLEYWSITNDSFISFLSFQNQDRKGDVYDYGNEWLKFFDMVSGVAIEKVLNELPDDPCLNLGISKELVVRNLMDRISEISKLSSVSS